MTPKGYLPFGRPNFSDREIEALSAVLRSGWVGPGPETAAFERELALAVEAPEVVTTSSGTAALFLALRVLGVGPADEVICPSLTWCSTANAALYLGARPVFCDVDERTLCLNADDVAARLSPRTKAVVAVHFGGLAADITTLRSRLPPSVHLVEDAAHAFGARYADGRVVGSSGHLTCFSFSASKNLSTGEGGAVALFDRAAAARLRRLRQCGQAADAWTRLSDPRTNPATQDLVELGYKMNFTDLQAAVGRVQLARQPELCAIRTAIARRYASALMDRHPDVLLQDHCTASSHAKYLFVIQLRRAPAGRRDALLRWLRERSIGAGVHYRPLHMMPLYSTAGSRAALAVTEQVCDRILTLPISASLTVADADVVLEGVTDCLAKLGC